MERYEGSHYEPKIVEESIVVMGEAVKDAPKIVGIPSGVEGLDELFFTVELKDGKLAKKNLGGIPAYAVFNVTGVSDTGKSLFVEQFAVTQAARGERVAFVTVESPAIFVARGLEMRAIAMGNEPEKIEKNIIIIDAASHDTIRDNIPDLLTTLAHVIKQFKTRFVVIDSITGLYENREVAARTIVRRLFNFMKKWHQTALFVSQKRSGHEELTAEAAGGYAVSHIVDGCFVFAKELVDNTYKSKVYGKQVGDIVRLFRIDGCRLSGHDTRTHIMEITETGLVKILGPIGKE
ncbi:KaiC domain-containing protein [Pseudothermotoga sp.]|nr:KaiC domain-containing protein [Pseudothermotoga sp.]MCX7813770.1 KaiC domain-containing protein [Pseudothermotoga sp.]MDW8140588.1 KaiC domain-containing protein [Pseudothermotoga sp.]